MNELKDMLPEIKAYALSNTDIQEILNPDTRIITYPEFASMNSIDEAFDELGRCIYLFLTENEVTGHWMCMFRKGDIIEMFDSYGEKPDAQRNWLTEEQLDDLNQSEPYLTMLLKKSPYKVYYNTYQYQKERDGVNSCGRHCVARLICKDMSNLQYYNMVKEQMKEYGLANPDDFVALFTYQFIGK